MKEKGLTELMFDLKGCINVFAQAIGALAEIEMMKVANQERESQGLALAYDENAFAEISKKYYIDPISIRQYLFDEGDE